MGADGDASGAGSLQCLLVWRKETLQRELGGAGRGGGSGADSGVEKQEGAEREEPGLREEARGSCAAEAAETQC